MNRLPVLLLITLSAASLVSCSYRFYETGCTHPIPGSLAKYSLLDPALEETSGLLYFEDRIWSFNDSGGEAALYAVDPGSGEVTRKVIIGKASNVDWEAIAMNDSTIFIADVGNNSNTRDTLLIYMVPKPGYVTGDSILDATGVITLTFDEQIVRNIAGYSSHDCEALLAFGDSLYLFTKDWVEYTTSVYVFPGSPGHYHLKRKKQYHANIMVTGADLFLEKNLVALVGYRNHMPIVITYGFGEDPSEIECGGRARFYPLKRGRQVEGICFNKDGNIFITSERSLQRQTLFRIGSMVH